MFCLLSSMYDDDAIKEDTDEETKTEMITFYNSTNMV